MFNLQARVARGDKQPRAGSAQSLAGTNSPRGSDDDTPTVRQRLSAARRSGCLDLRSLSIDKLPSDALKLEHLQVLILGNNNLTAVPANLSSNFPRLRYLDLSNNQISTIPSWLAELEELEVLDLSGNEKLRGSAVPSGFGPIRHRVAVFVDGEESGNPEDASDGVDRHDNYDDGDDADEKLAENVNRDLQISQHKDDDAPDARAFFRRLESLDDFEELESFFRRRIAGGDELLLKYLQRRYENENDDDFEEDGESGDGGDPESSVNRRKERKLQVEYARKDKERFVADDRKGGRKTKAKASAGGGFDD